MTQTEQQQLLIEWNHTQVDFPCLCVHQLFAAQVERTPNAIAVVDDNQQLTYQQLNHKANQLAHYLRKMGVGREVLVGICCDRTLEMAIGLLGILKAGGAYVPLDPTYPQERLAFMLEDSQISILLTQQQLLKSLPPHQAQIICIDDDWGDIAAHQTNNPNSNVEPENLIYTLLCVGEEEHIALFTIMLDNMLVAHGRNPYVGQRKILVAMAEMIYSADISTINIL